MIALTCECPRAAFGISFFGIAFPPVAFLGVFLVRAMIFTDAFKYIHIHIHYIFMNERTIILIFINHHHQQTIRTVEMEQKTTSSRHHIQRETKGRTKKAMCYVCAVMNTFETKNHFS